MYYQCCFQQESCRVDEKELLNSLHGVVDIVGQDSGRSIPTELLFPVPCSKTWNRSLCGGWAEHCNRTGCGHRDFFSAK